MRCALWTSGVHGNLHFQSLFELRRRLRKRLKAGYSRQILKEINHTTQPLYQAQTQYITFGARE
jgi:hypothetical protein